MFLPVVDSAKLDEPRSAPSVGDREKEPVILEAYINEARDITYKWTSFTN